MKTAFVVMPYREPFETVYLQVVAPVLAEAGISVIRSNETTNSSDIVQELTQQIADSDLIIVEATTPNPNVYFEFGFAFANSKEFILLAQKDVELPFDTRQMRHLRYEMAHLPQLKEDLSRWLGSTKLIRKSQKPKQAGILARGEVFGEFFDAAILTEQFSAPIEKAILQDIKKGDILPCLHSYSTDIGSDCWLRLCSDPLYTVFHESMAFLEKSADAIFDCLPPSLIRSYPDFISLGPGNGFKDRTLLRSLSKKLLDQGLNEYLYYYPVDISPRILATAVETVRTDDDIKERLKIKALLGDFERLRLFAPVYDFRPEPNIFSLLGNTLGNLVHDGEFLKKLYRTMHEGDILLLEVRTKQSKLSLHGKGADQFGLSFAPLSHLGVPFDHGKIKVFPEHALSQIPGSSSLAVHYTNFSIRGKFVEDIVLSWVNFYEHESLVATVTGPSIGFKLLKSFDMPSLELLVLQK